jgi:drug/metabolite transporter (DMT)-like permease
MQSAGEHTLALAGGRRFRRGMLLMLLGVSVIATMDLVVKILSARIGIIQIAWSRYLVQTLVLAALVTPSVFWARCHRSPAVMLHLARALLLLVGSVSFIGAVKYLPLAEANAIAFLAPAFMALLAVPILQERIGARTAASIAIGFGGVAVILRPSGEIFGWAALLPLVMAICSAGFHVTTPLVARRDDPKVSLYYLGLLAVLATSLALPWSWTTPSAVEAVGLVAIGGLSAVGHLMMVRALDLAPVSSVAPLFYLHLLWALVYGQVFFGDVLDWVTAIGVALVAASGLLVYQRRDKALQSEI